jgi:hypothetical protein
MIAVVIVMVMLAIFVGLVASTANLILVVLLVGLMVGIPLLAAPRIAVWMILALGMISGFIYSTFASVGGGKLTWGVAMLGILLMVPCIIKLLTGVKDTPAFIWLALLFMLYTLMAAVLQSSPMNEYVAGLKHYFQMYGLMFALALLDFKAKDHQRWLNFMLLIALLQLPFCLYERIVVVPKLTGSMGHLIRGIDVVSGTLGGGMEGGSTSGDMVAYLIMAAAFVVARWKAGLVSTRISITLSIALLLPLILGETKIVVIMLPLVWLVLIRKEFAKKPVRFFLQLLGMLLLTLAIVMVYINMNKRSNMQSSGNVIEGSIAYNMGDKPGDASIRLNRTTVLFFWWDQQSWQDPLGLLFGNGLGSTSVNESTHIAGHIGVKYFGWGIEGTTASILLWETGLLGFLLFLSILSSAWFSAGRLWTKVTDPTVRADAQAIQACIAILALYTFYNPSLVGVLPLELITAYLLGYLGYLVRVHLPQQRVIMATVSPNHKI